MTATDQKADINTREYIRIEILAGVNEVRAWLDSLTSAAERFAHGSLAVTCREFASPSLNPTSASAPPVSGNRQRSHHRYNIYAGGALTLCAVLHCLDKERTLLELRRDDGFPLVAQELVQQLKTRFPASEHVMLAEKPRFSSGAPPLACNVWLEEQLRRLPDPAQNHHLYKAWLAHYITLKGYAPLDPTRSYRAAVSGCMQRMGKDNQPT